MIFKDFKNIEVETELGVSGIGEETKSLAKHAKNFTGKNVLEIGTGTGFIPIYLSKFDCHCEGTDINEKAIDCAKKNAVKNNVNVNFYISDLFENVSDKFNLIIFNPPLASSKSSFLNKKLEFLKSIFPRENMKIGEITYQLVKTRRRDLIKRFLDLYPEYLNKNGKILIHLHNSELSILKEYSFKILEEFSNFNIVLIEFN